MKPHDSAQTHVTGESEYVDDRPVTAREVHVGVVYSQKAHARIKKINFKKAEKIPGVVAFYSAKDFSHLHWGSIFQDQPFLAQDVVQFVGEGIALVVAENPQALRKACALVQVDYEELPAILDIAAAIEKKSFIGSERKIEKGDVENELKKSPLRLKGKLIIQGADHFYLESQAALAYPQDNGGVEVHSSSQHPTEVQHVVAHALGLEYKDVSCIVKRMGGAFGGKESQAAPFAAYAALVAHKLKRPARVVLTKDDDMIMTGKRNPFEIFYEVGFDGNGRLLALDAMLYSDGGAYADLSTAIMERAMLHCDNAYFLPAARIRGQVCKTHMHPHTAFRGFGGPKGVALIERILEEMAFVLKKDALDLRKLNCYQGSDNTTPYGQKVEGNLLSHLFSSLEEKCDYRARREEIKKWNKENKGELIKGLSMTAVKFGISFTTRFLNQGNALVHLQRDGSVQVSTGATEMGQGVNARIAELVAEEFGIDREKVRVLTTSTERNSNTSPTAASSGTDINGAAAVLAARKLKNRLLEVADHVLDLPPERWAAKTAGLGTERELQLSGKAPDGIVFQEGRAKRGKDSISFAELVNEAYLHRISLSEYAHYTIPHLAFDKLKGQGRAFLYYTQGVAASEVSINPVNGEVKVLRSDLLMDLGRPINEGLDIGQVTGGFVQGMGWLTTENLFYSKGKLLSHSPSTYKIPSVHDTPRIFQVDFIENEEKDSALIKGAKAVGEPPLLLAISVWTAIMNAISYGGKFPALKIPATSEEVLRAHMPEAFQRWEKA